MILRAQLWNIDHVVSKTSFKRSAIDFGHEVHHQIDPSQPINTNHVACVSMACLWQIGYEIHSNALAH